MSAIFVLFPAALLWAQDPSSQVASPVLESKEIALAKAEIQRISGLVDSGVLPRVRLEQAQEQLADAQDDTILARTLYGDIPAKDLSEQMADNMVAAAQRRVERQIKKLAEAQKLVDDGMAPASTLQPLQDELNARRTNLELAHSRSRLIGELAAIAKYEESMEALDTRTRIQPFTDYTLGNMVHYEGLGRFDEQRDLKPLEMAFIRRFAKPLPISADGQTAVHDSLGFDHRGRVDVAVNPNEPAGIWLRKYLESKGIPYFAFLRAIPGKATGAHIHIGPGSLRLHNAD